MENSFNDSTNEWDYDTSASMHSSIIMSVFADALAQETYDAELAGLNWRFSQSSSGLVLSCSGYSQHLTDFVLRIMSLFFADQGVVGDPFLGEKHVRTNKDRSLRALKSYLESKRADSYASFYTALLLSSRGQGIEHTIALTEALTLDSLKEHHKRLISSKSTVECLFSGNVSDGEAKRFFSGAQEIIGGARAHCKEKNGIISGSQKWTPGKKY